MIALVIAREGENEPSLVVNNTTINVCHIANGFIGN